MGQERYGAAFHAKKDLSDGDSLTKTIVKYAERIEGEQPRWTPCHTQDGKQHTATGVYTSTAATFRVLRPGSPNVPSANTTNYHCLPVTTVGTMNAATTSAVGVDIYGKPP